MDTAQWPQGIGLVNYKATEAAATAAKPMLENNNNINTSKRSSPSSSSSPRSQQIKNHQPLNCPRCDSTNTKFCYYNNYSLSQPRYFCKTCRRYWTEGGSLRNVPVGGGSRKNKRFSSSSTPILSKVNINRPEFASADPHQNNPRLIHYDQTPTLSHDLNLTYPPPPIIDPHHQNHDHHHHHHDYNHYSYDDRHQHHQIQNPNIDAPTPRGFFSSIFMPTVTAGSGLDPNTIYSSGFNIPLQEFKPATLNFSLDGDGLSSAIGSSRGENERVLFPVGEGVNNNNKSTSTGTATTATNDNFEQKEDSVAAAAGGNWNNNINNNNNNNGEMLGGELTW